MRKIKYLVTAKEYIDVEADRLRDREKEEKEEADLITELQELISNSKTH